jgi:hypothetical protein
MKQKRQHESVIQVVIADKSLEAMLKLCKNMAEDLMILIDHLQKVANEKLLTQSPKSSK